MSYSLSSIFINYIFTFQNIEAIEAEGLVMSKIFAYGEDAYTLWALEHRVSDILKEFNDTTQLSDCMIFYRPSFGRGGRSKA